MCQKQKKDIAMIKCLVIDDEPLALQQLAAYVAKTPFLTLVAECQSAMEAREVIEKQRVDAIFVDINMPDTNGMDFVRSLSAPPIVVFTTAYSDYAVEGYRVDAVDYLLKPFGFDDFTRAALRVKKRYELENQAQMASLADDDSIFLKTEHRIVRVSIADIRYVESMSEYLKLYIEGQRPVMMLFSMKRMEERLPPFFVRIHRSYIVNMKKIVEVSKNRVMMDAETYLPIGDNYKDSLLKYLNEKYLGR